MKNNIVVIVTYGYDHEHVNTLGAYGSMYLAKKAAKENKTELGYYDYTNFETYVVGRTAPIP